eukprot:scaffold6807_cov139-Isochrysis_galbana.AAC.5
MELRWNSQRAHGLPPVTRGRSPPADPRRSLLLDRRIRRRRVLARPRRHPEDLVHPPEVEKPGGEDGHHENVHRHRRRVVGRGEEEWKHPDANVQYAQPVDQDPHHEEGECEGGVGQKEGMAVALAAADQEPTHVERNGG